MKKDTRNYGKPHLRFAVGSVVQPPDEGDTVWSNPETAHRKQLEALRQYHIDEVGKGDPQEYELKKNQSKSIVQAPEHDPAKDDYEGDEEFNKENPDQEDA